MNRIIIFFIFSIFLLASCNTASKKESEHAAVKESVESVERIVKRYDNNVQSAIDARSFKYIPVVTKEAIDSTDVKLNNVKILSAKPPNKKLVDAAISYIESLRELILTEGGYSQLADSLSLDEAQEIDRLFSRSSQKAQQAYIKYSSLLEPSPIK